MSGTRPLPQNVRNAIDPFVAIRRLNGLYQVEKRKVERARATIENIEAQLEHFPEDHVFRVEMKKALDMIRSAML